MNDPRFREHFYPRRRRSVPAARDFTRRALKDWGITARCDDIVLCLGELASNAVLHGVPPGRGFRVVLLVTADGTLRGEVHDSGGGHPRIPQAGEGDESGRGLLLVRALADRWGVAERDPGKIVWCEFTG